VRPISEACKSMVDIQYVNVFSDLSSHYGRCLIELSRAYYPSTSSLEVRIMNIIIGHVIESA
jgi:hypothetical protein